MPIHSFLAGIAALATFASTAVAQQAAEPKLAITRHQITVNGSVLKYTARVGLIPILDNEAGDVHGHFGFVSYTLDRAATQPPRPVVVWNGGPGQLDDRALCRLWARRLRSADDQRTRPTPCRWSFTTTTPLTRLRGLGVRRSS
jgi:hypothetical protein